MAWEDITMTPLHRVSGSLAGLVLIAPLLEAKDLRDIELRRLFEPTPSELRAERAGRIYIYEGLREDDIVRAMREQFDRVNSMMFIRVRPTPVPRDPAQGAKPTQVSYQDDGC
jgi:hypothetical protein